MRTDEAPRAACADNLPLLDLAIHDEHTASHARRAQRQARRDLAILCAGCKVTGCETRRAN